MGSNEDEEAVIILSRSVVNDLDELCDGDSSESKRREVVSKMIRKRAEKKRKKAAD